MARRDYSSESIWTEARAHGREVRMGLCYFDGKQRQKVLGDVREGGARSGEGMSKTQAEKALREARSGTEQGRARTSARTPRATCISLGEAAETHFRWLEGRGRKERTVEGYREMTRAHLVPFFRDRDIAKITRQHVEDFIDHMRDIGRKPETIKNYVNLLHAILGTAMRRGHVVENVVARADNVPTGESGDGVIRCLRLEDVKAIIRAEHADVLGQTMQVIYLVATMTGLRMGEMRALRWENASRRRFASNTPMPRVD